jgi:hypothetical protein
MAIADIQTSLAGGELSPQLYARVDLAKFQVGAALLRNFFVDYRGGTNNRAGTKYEDKVDTGARVIPFIVSTEAAYVLVFSNLKIRVYNLGVFVTEVAAPYLVADLFQIRYTQSADVLTLVHPSYPPADLSRLNDTTFSYDVLTTGPITNPPIVTDMVAPHSGPYSYGYLVTAVDLDGREESLPSNPAVKHSEAQNETDNRVIGLSWTAPLDVASDPQPVARYNVYKWGPIDAVTLNPATVWGFIGSSQTTTFTDNNIAPDFSKQPPGWGDPFSGGQFQSITVNSGGAGYDGVSGDWPVIPYVPLTIVGDGSGAAGYAVIDHATGEIIGVFLTNSGKNYTHATVTANGEGGTGATFFFTFTDPRPLNPAATAYLQQRRVFGGANLKPETVVMSQTGLYNNYNTTPVQLATDAIVLSISAEQVNTIKSLVQVSYGLLAFTSGGSFLINGGSPGAPIDAASPSVQAQASEGANDLRPLSVNADVVYGQAKGNRIRNLAFAWQRQSYTGSDVSTLAAHLFDTFKTVDWTWSEEPFKLVWAVRNDGRLLSMTYVPDEEVRAWCRHDTQGQFKSVCSVPEGDVDAVYFIVQRYVPANNPTPGDPAGNWVSYLERMAERQGCCIFDAWHLDCAVSNELPQPNYTIYPSGTTGDITIQSSFTLSGRIPDVSGIESFHSSVNSLNTHNGSCIDWDARRIYIYSRTTGESQVVNIDTLEAVVSVTNTDINGNSMLRTDADGILFSYGPTFNSTSLTKVNQATLATISVFGADTISFVTTHTQWAIPADFICAKAGGIGFIVSASLQSPQTNNEVAVLNTDTMAWTGTSFHTDPDQNTTNSIMCAGPVTSSSAVVYLTTLNATFVDTHSLYFSIYAVTVNADNIHTMEKLFAVQAAAVGWTHLDAVDALYLDETDDNLIAVLQAAALVAYNAGATYSIGDLASSAGHDFVSLQNGNTGNTPAASPTFWRDLGIATVDGAQIVKINAVTGAVLWIVPQTFSIGARIMYQNARITKGLFCFFTPDFVHHTQNFYQINTATGAFTTTVVNGVLTTVIQFWNSDTGEMIFGGDYTQAAGTPVPIGSTPTSFTALLARWGPAPPATPVGPFENVGDVIQIGCGKAEITAITNSTQIDATVIEPFDIDIPDDADGAVFFQEPGTWTLTTPTDTVTGLDHLEGKEVWSLADGIVVGPLTVAGGSVTLLFAATNIVVGLRYTQQIQTLYLTTDGIQQGSDQGKRKQVSGITLRVDCTKGLKVGTDFDYLTELPELNEAGTELFTGDSRALSFPQWGEKGEVCIQQDDPLPASVLGIIVEVTPGDTGR